MIARRTLLGSIASGLALSGCDKLDGSPAFRTLLNSGERLSYRAQRLLVDRAALAPEFSRADLSPIFRANGNQRPAAPDYARHLAENFVNWRLVVDGMVATPLALSLEQIFSMPHRTQITRHDCVEGWSAIGQWSGVPLRLLLQQAGVRSSARFIVFHCADTFGTTPYYESVDMVDALHPQSIVAYALNGHRLPVPNGAPLRLRVERHLGYKQAKYLSRIEAVASLAGIGGGKGGFWEDSSDYEWFAGI